MHRAGRVAEEREGVEALGDRRGAQLARAHGPRPQNLVLDDADLDGVLVVERDVDGRAPGRAQPVAALAPHLDALLRGQIARLEGRPARVAEPEQRDARAVPEAALDARVDGAPVAAVGLVRLVRRRGDVAQGAGAALRVLLGVLQNDGPDGDADGAVAVVRRVLDALASSSSVTRASRGVPTSPSTKATCLRRRARASAASQARDGATTTETSSTMALLSNGWIVTLPTLRRLISTRPPTFSASLSVSRWRFVRTIEPSDSTRTSSVSRPHCVACRSSTDFMREASIGGRSGQPTSKASYEQRTSSYWSNLA